MKSILFQGILANFSLQRLDYQEQNRIFLSLPTSKILSIEEIISYIDTASSLSKANLIPDVGVPW
jgi:hypothetical protein